jgi:hypothetical protein
MCIIIQKGKEPMHPVKDKVLEVNPVLEGDPVPDKRNETFTCMLGITRWLMAITLTTSRLQGDAQT